MNKWSKWSETLQRATFSWGNIFSDVTATEVFWGFVLRTELAVQETRNCCSWFVLHESSCPEKSEVFSGACGTTVKRRFSLRSVTFVRSMAWTGCKARQFFFEHFNSIRVAFSRSGSFPVCVQQTIRNLWSVIDLSLEPCPFCRFCFIHFTCRNLTSHAQKRFIYIRDFFANVSFYGHACDTWVSRTALSRFLLWMEEFPGQMSCEFFLLKLFFFCLRKGGKNNLSLCIYSWNIRWTQNATSGFFVVKCDLYLNTCLKAVYITWNDNGTTMAEQRVVLMVIGEMSLMLRSRCSTHIFRFVWHHALYMETIFFPHNH